MPDTSTEVAIATTTLTGNTTNVTFSSIPNTYTDLRLVFLGVTNPSVGSIVAEVRFNGDTGTNYSRTELYGDGTTAGSVRNTNATRFNPNGFVTTTSPLFFTLDVFSYAGSTNKTCLMTNSTDRNGSGTIVRAVGLWRNTSAITSITMVSASPDDFAAGTTATLYGIL